MLNRSSGSWSVIAAFICRRILKSCRKTAQLFFATTNGNSIERVTVLRGFNNIIIRRRWRSDKLPKVFRFFSSDLKDCGNHYEETWYLPATTRKSKSLKDLAGEIFRSHILYHSSHQLGIDNASKRTNRKDASLGRITRRVGRFCRDR